MFLSHGRFGCGQKLANRLTLLPWRELSFYVTDSFLFFPSALVCFVMPAFRFLPFPFPLFPLRPRSLDGLGPP